MATDLIRVSGPGVLLPAMHHASAVSDIGDTSERTVALAAANDREDLTGVVEVGEASFAGCVASVGGVGLPTNSNDTANREAANDPIEDNSTDNSSVSICSPCGPSGAAASPSQYDWHDDLPATQNYAALGKLLARGCDLYRCPGYGGGLWLLLPGGQHTQIKTGADLAPVIADRVAVTVYRDGKPKACQVPSEHCRVMIRTEVFLRPFRVVDIITQQPICLPDFSFTVPGYNDCGPNRRYLYVGNPPAISGGLDRTRAFLDAMPFDTPADCTNTMAAALTVVLRNHWPGGKPIVLVTANKSHAGKDTVIRFASGTTKQCSISYQSTNWPVENSFVAALNKCPDAGVVVVENARVEGRERVIASAFIERFATDPEPLLSAPGVGASVPRPNNIVLAISTNCGSVNEDILNRSLPIHLRFTGNISDRPSPIGNPKDEYLPTNREEIASEMWGLIGRWKEAGMPLNNNVRHPFSNWAKTIGGILAFAGFEDFLANYSTRRAANDPVREALALLGTKLHGETWYRPEGLSRCVTKIGITKKVIPPGDQDSEEGRRRGIGKVLSEHQDETFTATTETEILTLRLERKRGRFGENQPHIRYRFAVVAQQMCGEDGEA